MSLGIRLAEKHDVPLILTFIRELAEFERLSHEVVASEALLEASLFGEKPAAECLIAQWNGDPVGFALFFTSFSTFLARPGLYLEDLYVRPSARGRGIGEALLQRLARLTVERRYGRLDWCVLDWNSGAIRFYDRIGARPMSDWRIYRLTGEKLREVALKSGVSHETQDAHQ